MNDLELVEEQEDILYLLSIKDTVSVIDMDEEELIYKMALDSHGYAIEKVDEIIGELQDYGYVNKYKKITPQGTNYLKHHTQKDKLEQENKVKMSKLDSKIKIISSVVAFLVTIITTALAIYNALKK